MLGVARRLLPEAGVAVLWVAPLACGDVVAATSQRHAEESRPASCSAVFIWFLDPGKPSYLSLKKVVPVGALMVTLLVVPLSDTVPEYRDHPLGLVRLVFS